MEKICNRMCKVFVIVAEVCAILLTMFMVYSTTINRIEFDECTAAFIFLFAFAACMLHTTQESIGWD